MSVRRALHGDIGVNIKTSSYRREGIWQHMWRLQMRAIVCVCVCVFETLRKHTHPKSEGTSDVFTGRTSLASRQPWMHSNQAGICPSTFVRDCQHWRRERRRLRHLPNKKNNAKGQTSLWRTASISRGVRNVFNCTAWHTEHTASIKLATPPSQLDSFQHQTAVNHKTRDPLTSLRP